MEYQFIENITKEEHDQFVMNHPQCNLLQSAKWGEIKANWKQIIVGVNDGKHLIASSSILIKPLPLGITMFYIPRGPVMDYENPELVRFFLSNLKKLGKKYHCLFITFDPAIHCNDYVLKEANENHYPSISMIVNTIEECGAKFKGFTKELDATIQPRYHANVYRCDAFEDSLHKTVKKALQTVAKKKVALDAYGSEGVSSFARVMRFTEERKNIQLRDEAYFQKIMDTYGDDAVIYLAKLSLRELYEETNQRFIQNQKDLENCPENAKKKRFTLEELHVSLTREVTELKENLVRDGDTTVISGALCVKYGPTSEILYAGMNDRYKRYMAPYASFYSCMTWSFAKGCAWSNMGGIEGNLRGGLTTFKANYNPLINEFIGEFDLPVYPAFYALAQGLMKLRKKIRNRK